MKKDSKAKKLKPRNQNINPEEKKHTQQHSILLQDHQCYET